MNPKVDLGLYLGCVLILGEAQLHDGKKVKTITYNMEGLSKLFVDKYLDIVGTDTKLKKVSSPSYTSPSGMLRILLVPRGVIVSVLKPCILNPCFLNTILFPETP